LSVFSVDILVTFYNCPPSTLVIRSCRLQQSGRRKTALFRTRSGQLQQQRWHNVSARWQPQCRFPSAETTRPDKVQCSIMYVQCNKVRIRFSRRQASFRERAQLSLLQRLQWLTADDENRLALTAQPRNRLGLIVKIDADLKRTVVEYQRVKAPNAEQTKTRYQNYCRKPVPAFRDHALKFHAAQPQRIANDADGGKRHGRRGDDRRQLQAERRIEYAGRDRHAGGIIDKGKEQVLPDIAHDRRRQRARFHDPGEVALEQRDAGAFDRHIGAGAHGDTDLGGGQCRRIIDAVAGHGHHAAFGAQFFDHSALLIRQHLSLDFCNAEPLGDGERGGTVVAGEHHHADAVGGERLERFRGRGLDRIGDGDDAGRLAVDAKEDGGGAVATQPLGLVGKRRRIDIEFG